MKKHKIYWDALKRLQQNKNLIVPKGSKINKDTVALEAGRKRGSIKKSRAAFNALIAEIDQAAKEQDSDFNRLHKRAEKNLVRATQSEARSEEGLNRELMMLHQISILEKKIRGYEGS